MQIHTLLVERMNEYFRAGLALDVDRLDTLYDASFENVRTDEAGRTLTLTKAHFMAQFRMMRAQGRPPADSVDDARFLTSTAYGDVASVIVRREEDGVSAVYNFVWRMREGRPTTLLREFSVERDISVLIHAVEAANATHQYFSCGSRR